MAVKKKAPVNRTEFTLLTKKEMNSIEWTLKIGKGHSAKQKKHIKSCFEASGEGKEAWSGVKGHANLLLATHPQHCEGWIWDDVLWRFFWRDGKFFAFAVHREVLDKLLGRPLGHGIWSDPENKGGQNSHGKYQMRTLNHAPWKMF